MSLAGALRIRATGETGGATDRNVLATVIVYGLMLPGALQLEAPLTAEPPTIERSSIALSTKSPLTRSARERATEAQRSVRPENSLQIVPTEILQVTRLTGL